MLFKDNEINLITLISFLLGSIIFVVATNSTINDDFVEEDPSFFLEKLEYEVMIE